MIPTLDTDFGDRHKMVSMGGLHDPSSQQPPGELSAHAPRTRSGVAAWAVQSPGRALQHPVSIWQSFEATQAVSPGQHPDGSDSDSVPVICCVYEYIRVYACMQVCAACACVLVCAHACCVCACLCLSVCQRLCMLLQVSTCASVCACVCAR